MDLVALRAFVKVTQTGSFTRAAEALGTRKAHLSRVIAALEKDLGVRLLARTTRSLSLTEIGRDFFERAMGILGAVEDAERAVQNAQGEPRGVLKLTCGVEFGMIAVSGWIATCLERHPEVRVDADFTSRVVDIVHEGFDLAIRVGPLADSALVARRLGDLHYGLYASGNYLDRRGTPVRPEDLVAHDTLAFAGGSHQSTWALSADEITERITAAAAAGEQRVRRPRCRDRRPRDRPASAGDRARCSGCGPAGCGSAAVVTAAGAGTRGLRERALPDAESARVHRPGRAPDATRQDRSVGLGRCNRTPGDRL